MGWAKPTNVTEVKSFLGLIRYYRWVLNDFSKIASPLTNFLKKVSKFEWTNKCEKAFPELQNLGPRVPSF